MTAGASPLTEEEAKNMLSSIEKMKTSRAEKLPTAVSALSAVVEAIYRLRELGWLSTGPRLGEEMAIIEFGSTGMRTCVCTGEHYICNGYVYSLGDKTLMFKPLDRLTDDERELIDRLRASDDE